MKSTTSIMKQAIFTLVLWGCKIKKILASPERKQQGPVVLDEGEERDLQVWGKPQCSVDRVSEPWTASTTPTPNWSTEHRTFSRLCLWTLCL